MLRHAQEGLSHASLAGGAGLLAILAGCRSPDAFEAPPRADPDPLPTAAPVLEPRQEPVPQADRPARHDPMQGIDPNGRIPNVDLPADLNHPERWRYFPEGRIPEGSFAQRFLVSTFAVPVFFFEGDVGAGGGASITDTDFREKRRNEFMTSLLTYTTEGQQSWFVYWRRWFDQHDLPGGGVIQEERSWVEAYLGYTKTLTRRFFGFGPDSHESDESSYTDTVGAAGFNVQSSLPGPGDDWVASAGLRAERRYLGEGFVSGVDHTEDRYPEAFADGDDLDSLWVDLGWRFDTRDSQQNPYRGGSLGAFARGTPLMTGGRSGALYTLAGSIVFPLPGLFHDGGDDAEQNPPTDVLALAANVTDSTGDLPFWAQPSLGGSHRLRGHIAGRFTDEAAWFAAAEYRFAILARGFRVPGLHGVRVERLGLALFYELGDVGAHVGDLSLGDPKSSYGVSLRVVLERPTLFRFDFGFSEEGNEFTALYGLSF